MTRSLNKSTIFDTITYIKAIAIILVVVLHSQLTREYDVIYLINTKFLAPFRMPAFMFVSGFLYIYITFGKKPSFREFLNNKFIQLIVPLFTIKFINILIRLFKHNFLGSDFYYPKSGNFTLLLKDIIFYPIHDQPGFHLWFVYTLFLIFMIVYLFSSNTKLFAFFSLIIFFIPMPDLFALNYIQNYMIFFALGNIIAKYYIDVQINMLYVKIFFVLCILAVLIIVYLDYNNRVLSLVENICGLVGITSLSLLISNIKINKFTDHLKVVGNNSYSIYFIHPYINQIVVESMKSKYIYLNNFKYILGIVFAIGVSILINKYLSKCHTVSAYLLFGRRIKAI